MARLPAIWFVFRGPSHSVRTISNRVRPPLVPRNRYVHTRRVGEEVTDRRGRTTICTRSVRAAEISITPRARGPGDDDRIALGSLAAGWGALRDNCHATYSL